MKGDEINTDAELDQWARQYVEFIGLRARFLQGENLNGKEMHQLIRHSLDRIEDLTDECKKLKQESADLKETHEKEEMDWTRQKWELQDRFEFWRGTTFLVGLLLVSAAYSDAWGSGTFAIDFVVGSVSILVLVAIGYAVVQGLKKLRSRP